MSAAPVSRRTFLKTGAAVGVGLTIAVELQSCAGPRAPATDAPFAPNAWLRIRPDGTVTVVVDRSEMGQGISTGLPMLVAEELDADWSTVKWEQAPAGEIYKNPGFPGNAQGTGGSSSIRVAWVPLREAGARARMMLVAAAAARWSVSADSCRTEKGRVFHDASGRSLGYGELAVEAGKLPVPEKVTLKSAKDFRIIGRTTARLDLAEKVNGTAQFGQDPRVAGMLVAAVARCPVFGGKLKDFDPVKARQAPGVRFVVKIDSGVAVVAENFHQARQARDLLQITWDEGPSAELDSDHIRARLKAAAEGTEAKVVRKEGAGSGGTPGATPLDAVYELPYLAHACMEPMGAAADVQADHCTVWAPTQFQWGDSMGAGGCEGVAAKYGGVSRNRVTVHTTQLGGGFGRKFELDFVIDAVQISKAIGKPVRVSWTREDDTQHDYYRPASYHLLRASVSADGSPVSWYHRIATGSIMRRFIPGFVPDWVASKMGILRDGADPSSTEGAYDLPYAFPDLQVEDAMVEAGVPIGFWRSVGHSHTAFVTECFLDEVAHAAGKDPVAFRQALLAGAPRHLAVLNLAAEKAGWGTPLPAGRGRGVAVHESFGSWVAQVAEVSVEGGKVRVHRVVCAVDCGTAVNPGQIEAQMQSAIVYGLSAALYGEITIKKGRVVQSNFFDYPVLRMNEMPVVEVYLVDSQDVPGGVGEPGTPPIAPAVVNAIFAATGTRLRKLPIRL